MVKKALLVGAGGMGRAWARNLTECDQTTLVGWVDIRPEAAEQGAQELELSDIYIGDDLKKAIEATKPDFVVDVTVPEAHHDVTITALEAGLPVLGEKPMAHSMEAAREMVAVAERTGKLYMVSQSRRYDARIAAYRRLIQENLGPIEILNSDFYLGPHFGGFRDEMDHVLLLDMAIHTFDAARYLSGADPVSVYCEEFNPSWSWYRGAACANACFEMTGGLRYTYRGSWCAEGRMTSWEAEWRAVGPKGTATWNGHDQIVAEVVVEPNGFFSKTEERTVAIEPEPGGIAGSLRDFLRALETGLPPMGECHDNIKSLAMVFAAIESATKGQRVPVTL
ncbi:predicted dehydrogenase [Chthonomonas calidirosea]|uniref:Gfo/Idh/MocA family protein n=1 Tax=Chthonomonas calidirosea TaxID=454171 RepID=UPI0006DD4D8C|nr:Gfo/Idh/MocA family oxidoreductase [Chthonomonas calidirosea]CEK17601.1 predicted dehydrogenase [Chthonomonas calidirosea]CEK17602.1 predicted dehydrogenase [Chthonomonas calidirosea]